MFNKKNNKWFERFALFVILMLFSFLILGAGKVTTSLRKRTLIKKTENARWSAILSQMRDEVPEEYKEEWEEVVVNDPDKLIRTVYNSVNTK